MITTRAFSSCRSVFKQFIPKMSLEYTPERFEELKSNVSTILTEVNQLNSKTTLVCVSKLKPASDIKALYDMGFRHFGENYVQELTEKVKTLPKDINWHFIGGLQSNKCKDLAVLENLYVVETIDSLKKARKLNDARKTSGFKPIGVCVQVNTSNEEQKSGCDPKDVNELIKFIIDAEFLEFKGLMTIGSYGASVSDGVNPEFQILHDLKVSVEKQFEQSNLMLSMGMSSDFVQAIEQGSTSVRVGSSIFGARPPNNGH